MKYKHKKNFKGYGYDLKEHFTTENMLALN